MVTGYIKLKESQWTVRCTVLLQVWVHFFALSDRDVVTTLMHNNIIPIQTEVISSYQELLITLVTE
jgi:hypothetical protein